MQIIIIQKKGEKFNHRLIESATEFFITKLVRKRDRNKIGKIRISLVKEFESSGECNNYTREDGKLIIEIKIWREVDFANLISTLAHELIHAAQVVHNYLIIDENLKYWWKGVCYGHNPYYNLFEIDDLCKELPWEKEAYDREATLACQFFQNYYQTSS